MSSRPPVSNDLQERTLKVTNIPEQVTKELLYELFLQCGPVKNVVLKPEFAFIEFDHKISVGYALALMDGITLHNQRLELHPKLTNDPSNYIYLKELREYETVYASEPKNWWDRFGRPSEAPPRHLCLAAPMKIQESPQTSRFDSYYSSPWTSDSNIGSYKGMAGSPLSPRDRDHRQRDYMEEPYQFSSPDNFRDRGTRNQSPRSQNIQREYHSDRRHSHPYDRRAIKKKGSVRGSNYHTRR